MAKLPLYELLINEDEETGVDFIALVDSPAIEYDWVAFKSEFETYNDYPKAASENAKRALELRDKYELNCGTPVGWTRANQLANGENISRETIARMSGFERHRENSKGDPKEDCGALMWLAWGGDEGIEWASRKLQQIDFVVEPKAGESENDFVSRCIGIEIDGGMSQEQAAAVCYAKWEKKGFSFKTTDKQIISGPAMIPDQPIYRRKDGEEYNVVFTKSTIQKIVERYFKNQYNSNFNLQHKKNMLAEGVYLIESFIIDSTRGIKAPEGFEDLPDGSWFISCKVDNEEIWNDYIKSGKFKGFSVEGLFTDRKVEMVSNVEQAIALVDKLKLSKQNIYTNNMSDVKVLLSKLKEIFTEEAPMSFEEAKLADGLTIIKWEGPLAEGTSVVVVSEAGEVPAPDGEHELQDGRKITVENGKVTALVMPEVPAETPEEESPIEIEIEAKQKMAEDYMPMIEEMGAKIMKMEEMLAALEAKISEKMGTAEEKMNSQKEAFSKLVEIVEKLADAPSAEVDTKSFNVNFKAEKDKQYNKLDEILNILNK